MSGYVDIKEHAIDIKNENNARFGHRSTGVWTRKPLSFDENSEDFYEQLRLRMNYDDLGEKSLLLKNGPLIIEGQEFYPNFRLSFKVDKSNKIKYANLHGKFGNIILVMSPHKIAGRYNLKNNSSDLIIINIHLYVTKTPVHKNSSTQLEAIMEDVYSQQAKHITAQMFNIKKWPLKKEFSQAKHDGNKKFSYVCTQNSFVTSLGLEQQGFILLTNQNTFDNFLSWR